MKISKFKDFQLKKSEYRNVFGGNDEELDGGKTWQKTYAKNDPDHTTYWRDYVD